MVYFFVFITFIFFCWKSTWFREKVLDSFSSKKRFLKLILFILLVYFLWWSFFNYYFYVNLFILHTYFDYGLIESINIASNLTNELSTFFYYTKLLMSHLFENNSFNRLLSELEMQISQTMSLYSDVSSLSSGMEALNNLFKLLF